jgi:hypothetical protein
VVQPPSQTQNPITPATTSADAGAPAPDAATASVLCQRCTKNDDCGSGNFCVSDPKGGSICGTACGKPEDCPSGFLCYPVTDSANKPIGANCFPANYGSCFDTQEAPDSGTPGQDAGQATPDLGVLDSAAPPEDAGAPDASAPSPDAGGGADGGLLPFGAPCTTSPQCASGLCFNFNARGMLCTEMCVAGTCPEPTSLGCNGMGVCKVP